MACWHGKLGNSDWAAPECVAKIDSLARPRYDTVDASEYVDRPDVLAAKVEVLAELISGARELAAYTGAGLSTAAGIADYASKRGSVALQRQTVTCGASKAALRELRPTLSHRALAALAHRGTLKHWVNQNHDGLAQKATCPPQIVNEIHGAWFDPRNPVVKMNGSLRDDLMDRMEAAAWKADLVLALGTSLCGLYADTVALSCADRADKGRGAGLVIVSLQRTAQDHRAALRIFARLDDVFALLASRLALELPTDDQVAEASRRPFLWYHYMYGGDPTYKYRPESTAQMRKRCGLKPQPAPKPTPAAEGGTTPRKAAAERSRSRPAETRTSAARRRSK